MVKLTEALDPSLEAAEKEVVKRFNAERDSRHYLGASEIGKACSRELWYSFRKVKSRHIPYSGIVAIEDGYAQEEVAKKRLGTVFKMGDAQAEISLFSGHFKGHIDGTIQELVEAKKSVHVWEHKSCNEKKYAKLLKLKEEHGALEGGYVLEKWDPIYYAQATIYMFLLDLKRHFLTVSTPGGRNWQSVRTRLKAKFAKGLIKRAKSIIFSDVPPPRIAESKGSFACKWCDYKGICWDGETHELEARCQNCVHAEPVKQEGAKWKCRMNKPINELIPKGEICEHHIFIPPIVPLEQTACQTNDNGELVSITYSNRENRAGSGRFENA